jgi:hypothetical protein
MLQRFFIHLALIVLFAFTQMGVATHEISHIADTAKHSQQDKSKVAEQCGQCISYAKLASGLQLSAFVIPAILSGSLVESIYNAATQAPALVAYKARAPPQIIS